MTDFSVLFFFPHVCGCSQFGERYALDSWFLHIQCNLMKIARKKQKHGKTTWTCGHFKCLMDRNNSLNCIHHTFLRNKGRYGTNQRLFLSFFCVGYIVMGVVHYSLKQQFSPVATSHDSFTSLDAIQFFQLIWCLSVAEFQCEQLI